MPTIPKLGLERMRELLARLGNPQLAVRTLHVAGTKGKGSTCAFAESVLRAAGMRTGLTTSPHLCTARERIVVDGAMIDEARFASLERRVRKPGDDLEASFFERTVAMAWLAFKEANVDVAVVEVGLGGRLDATNVCAPMACAITRLGLDHVEHLGPTLEGIAREKAGILKRGVPAVSSQQQDNARAVLEQVARDVGAPLTFVPTNHALSPSLAGDHQKENASVALALLDASGLGARIDDATRARGLAQARWPGRYETLSNDPLIVADGAHNETSALALAETVRRDSRMRAQREATAQAHQAHQAHQARREPGRAEAQGQPLAQPQPQAQAQAQPQAEREALTLVVGMTQGRDVRAFADALAPLRPIRTWVVAPRSPRARDPVALANEIRPAFAHVPGGGEVEVASSIRAALDAATAVGAPVLICGSLYLVGEARHLLVGVPMDPGVPMF